MFRTVVATKNSFVEILHKYLKDEHINVFNTIESKRTQPKSNQAKPSQTNRMKQENKELLEAVNRHFWRKDGFGVISYAIAPDGRTASNETLTKQFGKDWTDSGKLDKDAILFKMVKKCEEKYGEDSDFQVKVFVYSLVDKLWDEDELEVIEVLANEETIKNGVKEIFAEPHYSLINDYRADTLKLSPSVFQKIEKYWEDEEKKKNNSKKKK